MWTITNPCLYKILFVSADETLIYVYHKIDLCFCISLLYVNCLGSISVAPGFLSYHWQWREACWPATGRGCEGWAAHFAGELPSPPAAPGLRPPWGDSAGCLPRTRGWPAVSATGPVRRHHHLPWVLAPKRRREGSYSETNRKKKESQCHV